jgi:cytochrome c556
LPPRWPAIPRAQYRNADAAIKYRQSAMSLQGNHMARIFAMATAGPVRRQGRGRARSRSSLMLNRLQFAAFIEGSDKGNTRAKPRSGPNRTSSPPRSRRARRTSRKLVRGRKTGSLDQIKAAAGAVGQSCKACHDAVPEASSRPGAPASSVRPSGSAKPSTTRAVMADFFSILRHDDGADLGGVAHVVPPQGCRSTPSISSTRTRPSRAAAARSCCAPARVGVELVFADPAMAHRVRFGHQARDAGRQRLLVERLAHVEVQPRIVGA